MAFWTMSRLSSSVGAMLIAASVISRREGFSALASQATYFLTIDLPASGVAEPDRAFCLRAVKEAGVAAIPVSAFYEAEPVTSLLRLCFSKSDAVLKEGVARLARARDRSIEREGAIPGAPG